MLVDTHCHLGSDAFAADLDAVLGRAWQGGLGHVVVIGESREAVDRGLALAAREPRVSVTAGVHPHDASTWSAEAERWLVGVLQDPRVVAVGEIGLDYHYQHSPPAAQQEVFERQLALAAQMGKPVIIHAREADDDIGAALRAQRSGPAILHSFSSGPGLLRAGLDLGHYVSFSGMVTFRNWALDEAVRLVPADRILIESDAPYLAPVPYRGRRNEPAFVRHTAERVAAVRAMPVEALVAQVAANAARVFGPRVARTVQQAADPPPPAEPPER